MYTKYEKENVEFKIDNISIMDNKQIEKNGETSFCECVKNANSMVKKHKKIMHEFRMSSLERVGLGKDEFIVIGERKLWRE